jgi:hypothetical protein
MEHGAWSREQGAGSMEHGAGSREQGAGSREQGAGSREHGAGLSVMGSEFETFSIISGLVFQVKFPNLKTNYSRLKTYLFIP